LTNVNVKCTIGHVEAITNVNVAKKEIRWITVIIRYTWWKWLFTKGI